MTTSVRRAYSAMTEHRFLACSSESCVPGHKQWPLVAQYPDPEWQAVRSKICQKTSKSICFRRFCIRTALCICKYKEFSELCCHDLLIPLSHGMIVPLICLQTYLKKSRPGSPCKAFPKSSSASTGNRGSLSAEDTTALQIRLRLSPTEHGSGSEGPVRHWHSMNT